MSKALLVIVFVVGVLVGVSGVQAQLTWLSDPTTTVHVDTGATIISPMTALGTSDGMTVIGDLTMQASLQLQQMYVVESARPFLVGSLPIEVSALYSPSYKIAVSGGDESQPEANLIVAYSVRELSPGSVTLSTFNHDFNVSQDGNGIYIGGANYTSDDYILTPGISYELISYIQMQVGPQPGQTPIAAGTFEFGGVTSFDGLESTLSWSTVPEPCSLGLLALGGLGLMRRRK